MTNKELKKLLDKLPDSTEIGLNVLTDVGTEFWSLSMAKVMRMDGGETLALGQIRLRKALPSRVLLKVDTPGADGIDVDPDGVIDRVRARYAFNEDDVKNASPEDLQVLMLGAVRKDLQELVRLNDDLLRLYNNKKLTQRFKV